MKYSVIIPTFNEIRTIRKAISNVRSLCPEAEIIVADGGSVDGTKYAAKELGTVVVSSEKGRGIQLNAGAQKASGDILIFLHSDTILPNDAFDVLDHTLINDFINAGSFRLQFDTKHWFLKLLAWFTRFDSLFTSFGDHCVVVRREYFHSLHGFKPWKLFEDVDFLQRVRNDSFVYKFPATVTTSARRFKTNGIYTQQLRNVLYGILYHCGVSQATIVQHYDKMRHSHGHNALIIFARYPAPGKVKTRLASSIGNSAASDFYRICAERIFDEAKLVSDARTYLFFSDPADITNIVQWVDPSFYIREQSGSDLGEKMANAFKMVFQEGARYATIIGTDVPSVTADIITNSFRALDSNDVSIGPAHDGGYYLLGTRQFIADIFKDIEWSTAEVYEKTTGKLSHLGFTFSLLPTLDDIDTIEDLQRWINKERADNHPIKQWGKHYSTEAAIGLEL